MPDFSEYRKRLAGVATVDAALVHEIIDAAEAELAQAHGEFTIGQAMTMSGRSRSYFERRLARFHADGIARKVGRYWMLKRAAIPERPDSMQPAVPATGFGEAASDDEILRALRDDDEADAA